MSKTIDMGWKQALSTWNQNAIFFILKQMVELYGREDPSLAPELVVPVMVVEEIYTVGKMKGTPPVLYAIRELDLMFF